MGRVRSRLVKSYGAVVASVRKRTGVGSGWGFVPKGDLQVAVNSRSAPELKRGREFTVLLWNVQFATSRKHLFFYEMGGTAVSVPRSDVDETLEAIATTLREVSPDLVLLQEVDRASRRTGFTDQHRILLEELSYPADTSATYHRVAYIPHPPGEHLGRVDMHLSVFSRFRLSSAVRAPLPLLRESFVRRLFNLRRAILEVRIPLEGGGEFVVLNTHLSAFSKGDGTLPRQMQAVKTRGEALDSAGVPWFLGGDLNALPPGDRPGRLGPSSVYYDGEGSTPVGPLFDAFTSVISAGAYQSDPARYRTYLPFQAQEPDRTLDYAFVGRGVTVVEARVLHEYNQCSDHLPLLVRICVD